MPGMLPADIALFRTHSCSTNARNGCDYRTGYSMIGMGGKRVGHRVSCQNESWNSLRRHWVVVRTSYNVYSLYLNRIYYAVSAYEFRGNLLAKSWTRGACFAAKLQRRRTWRRASWCCVSNRFVLALVCMYRRVIVCVWHSTCTYESTTNAIGSDEFAEQREAFSTRMHPLTLFFTRLSHEPLLSNLLSRRYFFSSPPFVFCSFLASCLSTHVKCLVKCSAKSLPNISSFFFFVSRTVVPFCIYFY